MDFPGQQKMLGDQSGDQQDTEDAQEDGDRAGLFFFRDLLGQYRQGFGLTDTKTL